jgi:hypothetical protein
MIKTEELIKALENNDFSITRAAIDLKISKQRVDQLMKQRGLLIKNRKEIALVERQFYSYKEKQWLGVKLKHKRWKSENDK